MRKGSRLSSSSCTVRRWWFERNPYFRLASDIFATLIVIGLYYMQVDLNPMSKILDSLYVRSRTVFVFIVLLSVHIILLIDNPLDYF